MHYARDPNPGVDDEDGGATLFNDLLTRPFAQIVLEDILYIICSSYILLCMDNVCFFMSTGVSMFIFIFIFHPLPARPGRHCCCSSAVRRGDWCACVYIYILYEYACVGLCARNSCLLFTRKIKCTKRTCNKKIIINKWINKTDRWIIIFYKPFRALWVKEKNIYEEHNIVYGGDRCCV